MREQNGASVEGVDASDGEVRSQRNTLCSALF